MAKEPQELKWIEDLLPQGEYRRRSMFGGFAYYLGQKMIMGSFESDVAKANNGRKFKFKVWNGLMFPVERELQPQALEKFPFLFSHPILPKWLYLPLETDSFEELATKVVREIIRPHSYWGSIPKAKSRSKSTERSATTKRISTKTPRMFAEKPRPKTRRAKKRQV